MKVTITGTPKFRFPVSLQLVHALRKCSKHHYDGQCQRASAVSGVRLIPGTNQSVITVNGILTIWMNEFAFPAAKTSAEDMEVNATWDDLDLISKIMEMSPHIYSDDRANFELVEAFDRQVRAMMAHYNRYFAEWKAEVNV